jgi:hypothetical protein
LLPFIFHLPFTGAFPTEMNLIPSAKCGVFLMIFVNEKHWHWLMQGLFSSAGAAQQMARSWQLKCRRPWNN